MGLLFDESGGVGVNEYRNDRGQLDTYWRRLPATDDPAECMAWLISQWRSKRECEAAIYGDAEPPHGTTTGPMLMAEDEAIEALMDALAGTEKVEKPEPEMCAAAPDLVEAMREAVENCETCHYGPRLCARCQTFESLLAKVDG